MKSQQATYSPNKLQRCLTEIRTGQLSCNAASKVYGIPRTTLASKLSGYRPESKCRPGPQPTLGFENEIRIRDWILESCDEGYPISRVQLVFTMESFIESLSLKTRRSLSFKGKPHKSWYSKFLRRHPEIRVKKAEYLSAARARVTEPRIRTWFARTEKFLTAQILLKVLKDSSRVFNCDETAVYLNPQGGKVLGRRGRTTYGINGNDDKVNVTVLFTVNASGKFVQPTIVRKGQRRLKEYAILPDEWRYMLTPNGWMTCEAFLYYIVQIFDPYLKENNIKKPVVLSLDGHVSHISLQLSEYCKQNGIVLICFLPSATHVLQPLDKAVFKALKAFWRSQVDMFCMLKQREITKMDLPFVMAEMLEKHGEELRKAVVNGFASTGLYPWDVEAIKYTSKCLHQEKYAWLLDDEDEVVEPSEAPNVTDDSSFLPVVDDFPYEDEANNHLETSAEPQMAEHSYCHCNDETVWDWPGVSSFEVVESDGLDVNFDSTISAPGPNVTPSGDYYIEVPLLYEGDNPRVLQDDESNANALDCVSNFTSTYSAFPPAEETIPLLCEADNALVCGDGELNANALIHVSHATVGRSGPVERSAEIEQQLKLCMPDFCPQIRKKERQQKTKVADMIPVLTCDAAIDLKRAKLEEKERKEAEKLARAEVAKQKRLLREAQKRELQELKMNQRRALQNVTNAPRM